MNEKNVFILVGTRPNFIKITRFKKLAKQYNCSIKIIHTGQHYDDNMANIFFDQFGLRPDFFLDVSPNSPNAQIAEIMVKLEELFKVEGKPDLFIVPGDVNSTLAGAITANKLGIQLAHLESGLRSYDKEMPEEHNRVMTDHISNVCFVTEQSGIDNLKEEKCKGDVRFVGNTMIDTLVEFSDDIDKSTILDELKLKEKEYYLMTFHRPSNVDSTKELEDLVELISEISELRKIVLPLHPRTKSKLENFGLYSKISENKNLILTPPLGYFQFQKLIQCSKAVVTDSGGIQEETTFRQVPCLTMRNNTERPITLTLGSNVLVPFDTQTIIKELNKIEAGTFKKGEIPPLWDGKTTERILSSIV